MSRIGHTELRLGAPQINHIYGDWKNKDESDPFLLFGETSRVEMCHAGNHGKKDDQFEASPGDNDERKRTNLLHYRAV